MHPSRTLNRARLMITYARIVETGSISAASQQLGIDKAAVSRQLRDLEEQLGVRLLHRSTRRLDLTPIGGLVYERAQRVVFEVENAYSEAEVFRSTTEGAVCISASVAFGRMQVMHLATAFQKIYPKIAIQLCLLDRHVDPVEDGVDILLRLCDGPPEDFVAHRICAIQYMIVAAPSVASVGGKIETPQDLLDKPCLFYGFKASRTTWRFRRGASDEEVEVATGFSVNNSEIVRELALAAKGFALLPCFATADDVRQGRLVSILPEYEVRGNLGSTLFALHLPGRFISPKVKAFVDFVKAQWSSDDDHWALSTVPSGQAVNALQAPTAAS